MMVIAFISTKKIREQAKKGNILHVLHFLIQLVNKRFIDFYSFPDTQKLKRPVWFVDKDKETEYNIEFPLLTTDYSLNVIVFVSHRHLKCNVHQ